MTAATPDAPAPAFPAERSRLAWDRLDRTRRAALVRSLGIRRSVRGLGIPAYEVALALTGDGVSFERALSRVLLAIA